MYKGLIKGLTILLLLCLFILTACKDATVIDGPKEDGVSVAFLNKPTAFWEFYFGGEYYGYDISLEPSHVYSEGYSSLLLTFQDPIKQESYIQHLKTLEGVNLKVETYDFKTVRLNFINLKYGETISFTINKELESDNGLRLQEDIKIKYQVKNPIEVAYTLVGRDYSLFYPQGNHYPNFGEEDQLTNESNTISLQFSSDVDRRAIEEILKSRTFGDKDVYSIEWEDSKTLLLHMDKLTQGFYQIDLFTPTTPIVNKFHFTGKDPNILYSYSIKEGTINEEKVFHNFRYHFNINPYIKDYLLMADVKSNNYIYRFPEDTVQEVKEASLPPYLGMGPWRQEVLWLNSHTVLWLNDNEIITYNFKTNLQQQVFKIENIDHPSSRIFQFAISPDQSMMAFAKGVEAEDYSTIHTELFVYNMDGKKIYQGEKIEGIRTDWAAGLIFYLGMDWLSNSTLIHEVPLGDGRYGIAMLNIRDGSRRIILEDAIKPYTVANTGVVVAQRNDGYIILSNHKTITLDGDGITGFYIKDKDTLFFTREKNDMTQLIELNLLTQKERVMGEIKGVRVGIIGICHDKNKIYFITNHQFLLPIT